MSTTASHQQEDKLQEKSKALQLSLKRGGFGGFDFTEKKNLFDQHKETSPYDD